MRSLSPPHPGLSRGQVDVRGKNHPSTPDCEQGAAGGGEENRPGCCPGSLPWPECAPTPTAPLGCNLGGGQERGCAGDLGASKREP